MEPDPGCGAHLLRRSWSAQGLLIRLGYLKSSTMVANPSEAVSRLPMISWAMISGAGQFGGYFECVVFELEDVEVHLATRPGTIRAPPTSWKGIRSSEM